MLYQDPEGENAAALDIAVDGLNSAIASGLVCHKLNRLGAEENLPVSFGQPVAQPGIIPKYYPAFVYTADTKRFSFCLGSCRIGLVICCSDAGCA